MLKQINVLMKNQKTHTHNGYIIEYVVLTLQ